MKMLSDTKLLQQFEDLSLSPEQFTHSEHLRLAWIICGLHRLENAIDRFVGGLKRFAGNAGMPDLYHETVTLFYLYEIYARRQLLPADHNWAMFRSSNPDLFTSHREFIQKSYPEELLQTQTAKRHFIPPRLSRIANSGFKAAQ